MLATQIESGTWPDNPPVKTLFSHFRTVLTSILTQLQLGAMAGTSCLISGGALRQVVAYEVFPIRYYNLSLSKE